MKMGGPPPKKKKATTILYRRFTMLSPPKPFSRNKNILRCPWVFSPRPVVSPVKRSSYKPTYYPDTKGVWYICLRLPEPNVGKYTSPIGYPLDCMGHEWRKSMYFLIGTWWISIDIIECLGYHLPSTPSHHNFLDSAQLKAFIPISNVFIYALATEDFFGGNIFGAQWEGFLSKI